MLVITNVHTVILLMAQDDDNSDQELSGNESEHPGESTLSSAIEEDNLDNKQKFLHLDQTCRDKSIRTTRGPRPKKPSCTDTEIACTPLLNLQHPARAIAPPLLKRQKSTINILRESDVIPTQALPLPKACGDQNVPQPKAGGDHNVPQHQKATFEVAKQFMEATIFTKTPWPIISDEKYSMVDEAWKLVIEAQHCQRALARTPVGTPSVCQVPSCPSVKNDPQTREAVSVYSVFWSLIGLMMIPPEISIVKTKD